MKDKKPEKKVLSRVVHFHSSTDHVLLSHTITVSTDFSGMYQRLLAKNVFIRE